MKRVLSLATTGLFLAGLAMVPMSVRADQTAVDGKTVAPLHTDSTTTPKMAPTATAPVKHDDKTVAAPVKADDKKADDKKVTATPGSGMTPGGTMPASHGSTTAPGKGS
jgi:hypothetical protein